MPDLDKSVIERSHRPGPRRGRARFFPETAHDLELDAGGNVVGERMVDWVGVKL